MSVQLLDKTRKIGRLLHNNNTSKVVFNDICRVLSQTLSSDVVVISRKGKVLGRFFDRDQRISLIDTEVGDFIDPELKERLLGVLSTNDNINLATLGFEKDEYSGYCAIIAPIEIAGERLGTVFAYRDFGSGGRYDIDDIILCEYGMTVVGLEMMRSLKEEDAFDARQREVARSSMTILSHSEQEAVIHILDALEGREGRLVTSKIADEAGLTRSVVVNAMRKMETAGIMETRSSGMKGTNIRIRNDKIFEEIESLR